MKTLFWAWAIPVSVFFLCLFIIFTFAFYIIRRKIYAFFKRNCPEILQNVEVGKEIYIQMFPDEEREFLDLTKYLIHKKLLSFEKGGTLIIGGGKTTPYCLRLTDAFIKYLRKKG